MAQTLAFHGIFVHVHFIQILCDANVSAGMMDDVKFVNWFQDHILV